MDPRIERIIEDSSNGSEWLKLEIKRSDGRLKAVKSGIPLSKVVPKKDADFFIPVLESYFKGDDKIQRRQELEKVWNEEDHQDVKFFITEAHYRTKSSGGPTPVLNETTDNYLDTSHNQRYNSVN